MKIIDQGYTIEDVPGIDRITVARTKDGEVQIVVQDDADNPARAYVEDTLRRLAAALERAADLAQAMEAQNAR